MKFSSLDLKNYLITTVVSSFFLIFLVSYSEAPLSVTCEAGGPYGRNATVNVIGNVTTDGAGDIANITTNISLSGTQRATANTTSDSDGRYQVSYFLDFNFDTYTVAVRAENGSTNVYCTDTINIQLGINTSCENRVIRFEGSAVYSGNITSVSTGSATVGIAEERVTNSSAMNSTGGFLVQVAACLKKGNRYTANIIVDDNQDKRSSLQQVFVAP